MGLPQACYLCEEKKMSRIIVLDMLGKDGTDELKGIEKSHGKTLERENLKTANIYRDVNCFDHWMDKRRYELMSNTLRSPDKTYARREYTLEKE